MPGPGATDADGGGAAAAEAARLAEEQAALRRIATLVAEQAPQAKIFTAVAEELGRVLGVEAIRMVRFDESGDAPCAEVVASWGAKPEVLRVGERAPLGGENLTTAIFETGGSARRDDYSTATGAIADRVIHAGVGSAVGVPVTVEGRCWGAMIATSLEGGPLPPETQPRLAQFTELMATAIANAEARAELGRLAEEQAALRRVATLVAEGAAPAAVFDAAVNEVCGLLGASQVGLMQPDSPHEMTLLAHAGDRPVELEVGMRMPLEPDSVTGRVVATGRSARIHADERGDGTVARLVRRNDVTVSFGTPIVVAGAPWGVITANWSRDQTPPEDAEVRLDKFAQLLATAIAGAESRKEIGRLGAEQEALRRVATLVAEQVPAAELFAKVGEEVANLFGEGIDAAMLRFEPGEQATVVAVTAPEEPGGIHVGARMPIQGGSVASRIYRERRLVRVDDYTEAGGVIADRAKRHTIRAAIGCPIMVEGRMWGSIAVGNHTGEPFPPDAERRITQFADLVATAIANAQARAEVERLAEDQAALRRVATLVARGAAPNEVFEAAIAEVQALLDASQVGLLRFDEPDHAAILAQSRELTAVLGSATSVPLDGDSAVARVFATGRVARLDVRGDTDGTIADLARRNNVISSVAAPVTIEGRTWGAIAAAWDKGHPPNADAEARLAEFAELLDTAIANADSRDQLTASRARVLSAGDEARRRVVRDLHDGAQQRLVHTIVTLKLARQALADGDGNAAALLDDALDQAKQGNDELRELAHGILPSVLSRGGIAAGVDALVARLDLLVETEVTAPRLPPEIEASAYFVVAEALTNVVKHSGATSARVAASVADDKLRLEVADDGKGGADAEGHGLLGLGDRVEALGGRLTVESPPGGGTFVRAELPLRSSTAPDIGR
jgi:signal transduction histidine kinase